MTSEKYNIKSQRGNPTSQFDKRLIARIVREVEDGLPRKKACLRYGMAYTTINHWMRTYASEDYLNNLKSSSTSKKKKRNSKPDPVRKNNQTTSSCAL